MTLRKKIEGAIRSTDGNTEQAAIAVCHLLENEIGLSGNGWFDNDEEMLALLEAED